MEDTEMDIILSAVDNASDTFESVQSAAEGMGESVQEGAESGSEGLDDMEASAEAAADPLEQITTIIGGLAGAEIFSQLADTLWDFADKAGTFEDSLMRARLEAEGAGISVNDMTDTVSELGRVTGRAGGEIREAFITATARGITDLDSFKQMMIGAGAQATLLGTDIDSMANKMSGLAMRSSVMERTLANTGITVEELGEALGIQGATIDDINAKWETMDTNQRAAALGMAASMNEGKTANEEYKKSWAGLQAQLDIAKGRLERLAGEVLLPVLIPALETAGRVLNWVGDVVQGVMDGPFGGLLSLIGVVAAGFMLAVPAYMAVSGAITLLTSTAIPAAIALWGMVAPLLPFIIIGAAVAYAIYEIGKAFGWWTDVSSMVDAIWAGIQRLWSAFISHPDVQGFIAAMIPVWNWLQYTIASVIKWVQSFFQNNSGQKFDFVRALIDAVGVAWKALTTPIRLVITVVKLVLKAIQNWYLTTLARVNMVKELFRRLPTWIRGAISSLVNIITKPFKDAYEKIKGTVDSIKTKAKSITNISLSSLTDKIFGPVRDAYNKIKDKVDQIKKKIKEIPVVGDMFGGAYGFDYEGMLEEINSKNKTTTAYSSDENLTLDHNINFKFDFTNLPEGTSEENLIAMLRGAITDRSVINSLVNSPDFQALDGKVKNKITLKNGRARGV